MSEVVSLFNLKRSVFFEVLCFSDSTLENKCLELGLYVGKIGQMMHKAPFNGPIAIEFNKHLLSLRKSEACQIQVKVV